MKTETRVQVEELAASRGESPATFARFLLEKGIRSELWGDRTPVWLELVLLECFVMRGLVYRCLSEVMVAQGWSREQFGLLMEETKTSAEDYARERLEMIEQLRRESTLPR